MGRYIYRHIIMLHLEKGTKMSDAQKQANREGIMRGLAASLDEVLETSMGTKMGFILITFEFGKVNFSNYISNAQRGEIPGALRDVADKLESGEIIPATSH